MSPVLCMCACAVLSALKDCLSVLQAEARLMLQASQLLQWCKGSPSVLSGCITHRSR